VQIEEEFKKASAQEKKLPPKPKAALA